MADQQLYGLTIEQSNRFAAMLQWFEAQGHTFEPPRYRGKGIEHRPPVRRFELIDDLVPGSSATAKTLDSTAPGVTATSTQQFEIHDTNDRFRGIVGSHGQATWRQDNKRWEILSMQPTAGLVETQLNMGGGLSSTDAAATVDGHALMFPVGANWPTSTGAPLTIQNTYGLRADDNDPVLIAWNEAADDWDVIQTPRKTLLWFEATDDWSDGSPPTVAAQQTDADGSNPRGALLIMLPRTMSGDPAVFIGAPGTFSFDAEGNPVCQSDYMDDAIGTVKMWSLDDAVPVGWQLCDGTNGTVDMTGDGGRFAKHVDGDSVRDSGGEQFHGGGAVNNHGDHPSLGDHTIANHPGHEHNVPESTAEETAFDNLSSPSTGVTFTTTAFETSEHAVSSSRPSGPDEAIGVTTGTTHRNHAAGGGVGLSHADITTGHSQTDNLPPYRSLFYIERFE